MSLGVSGAILAAFLIIGLFCCYKRRKATKKSFVVVYQSATSTPMSFSNENYVMPVDRDLTPLMYTDLPAEPPAYSEIVPEEKKCEGQVVNMTKCRSQPYESEKAIIDLHT